MAEADRSVCVSECRPPGYPRTEQKKTKSGIINYELQIMEISNKVPVRREYHFPLCKKKLS